MEGAGVVLACLCGELSLVHGVNEGQLVVVLINPVADDHGGLLQI